MTDPGTFLFSEGDVDVLVSPDQPSLLRTVDVIHPAVADVVELFLHRRSSSTSEAGGLMRLKRNSPDDVGDVPLSNRLL